MNSKLRTLVWITEKKSPTGKNGWEFWVNLEQSGYQQVLLWNCLLFWVSPIHCFQWPFEIPNFAHKETSESPAKPGGHCRAQFPAMK